MAAASKATTKLSETTATAAPARTRGEQFSDDLAVAFRARKALIVLRTDEEKRAGGLVAEAAATAGYETEQWDCAAGVLAFGKRLEKGARPNSDPIAALTTIRDRQGRRVVTILRDMHKWSDPLVLRTLKNLAGDLQAAPRADAGAVVLLCPAGTEVPADLKGLAKVYDLPLPDRMEMGRILDDVLGALPEVDGKGAAYRAPIAADLAVNGRRDAVIDSALGLTADGAADCFTQSLIRSRRFMPSLIVADKKSVVAGIPGVTWHESDPRGFDALGGLDLFKAWTKGCAVAYGARARAYGLPRRKGVLFVGLPGGGKSLGAKCLGAMWGAPVIRLDLSAMLGKFVGESEGNLRRALAIIEAIGRCIVWIDELDKALAGATGAQGDGGVATNALATLLTWLQENTGEAFVYATANDVRGLPPEVLRKGRFDEIFWADLPTSKERGEILVAALGAHGRTVDGIDVSRIAVATEGFVGAEIAAIVPDALYTAFGDGERGLETADLLAAAKLVVPLAKTASEKISELRAWAKGRARPASTPETSDASGASRALDV